MKRILSVLIALLTLTASAQAQTSTKVFSGDVIARKEVLTVDARTIASNGNGATPATLTLTPASSYVSLTCNDPQGCTITMGESGIASGMEVTIINISANACTLADTSGVSELTQAAPLGQFESLTLQYVTDRWVERARSATLSGTVAQFSATDAAIQLGGFSGTYVYLDSTTAGFFNDDASASVSVAMDGTIGLSSETGITVLGLVTQGRTYSSGATHSHLLQNKNFAIWNATDGNAVTDGVHVSNNQLDYGLAAAAKGIGAGYVQDIRVWGSGDATNETVNYFANTSVNIGTGYTQSTGPTGYFWVEDEAIHGPIAVQPGALNGRIMLANNYYNGSPSHNSSNGMWIVTNPTAGNPDATHAAATTYAMDVGLGITGHSTSSGIGWTTAIQIGGAGSPHAEVTSKIGTGMLIRDYNTAGITFSNIGTATAPDITFAGFFQGTEMTAPAAAAADGYRIYAVDNGGKTELLVKFASGAAQRIAIEP